MTEESLAFERARQRAVELGERGGGGAWRELLPMLSSAAPRVRRAAASAVGKLVLRERSVMAMAVRPLFLFAMSERRDQVREYLFKALTRCAPEITVEMVKALRDVARNPQVKPYVRAAANEALSEGEKALRGRAAALHRQCVRCHALISQEEATVAMTRYGKAYCRHCLDERTLEDLRFEKQVDVAKRLRTVDRVAVQSRGEKCIGDWLVRQGIRYIYDARYRIVADAELRPDFYLPEFDIYIEYWGMETREYLDRKKVKQLLYQRAGKRLISLFPADLPRLDEILAEKLSRYISLRKPDWSETAPKDFDRSAVSRPSENNTSRPEGSDAVGQGGCDAVGQGGSDAVGQGGCDAVGHEGECTSRPLQGRFSGAILPHPAPKRSFCLR